MDVARNRRTDRISYLFRKASEQGIPIIFIIEGMNLLLIKRIMQYFALCLNPGNYELTHARKKWKPVKSEPFLTYYWNRIPAKGNVLMITEGYFQEIAMASARGKLKKKEFDRLLGQIQNFERTLADDGYVFFHFCICGDEKNLKKTYESKIKKDAWADLLGSRIKRAIKYYSSLEKNMETIIEKSDPDLWYRLDGKSYKKTRNEMFDHIIEVLEKRFDVDSSIEIERFDEEMASMRLFRERRKIQGGVRSPEERAEPESVTGKVTGEADKPERY